MRHAQALDHHQHHLPTRMNSGPPHPSACSIPDVLAAKWGPTLRANYLLWPAANWVNFSVVPPEQVGVRMYYTSELHTYCLS